MTEYKLIELDEDGKTLADGGTAFQANTRQPDHGRLIRRALNADFHKNGEHWIGAGCRSFVIFHRSVRVVEFKAEAKITETEKELFVDFTVAVMEAPIQFAITVKQVEA